MNIQEYADRVSGDGRHRMSGGPCARCGDMDGCWWTSRFWRAKTFAIEKHGAQRYGEELYQFHLANVVNVLQEYNAEPDIQVAAWLHDVVEDCDVSPLDIVEMFGEPLTMGLRVANLVWAVTNQDRKPRYDRILKVHGAVMLKLGDRIANVEYSRLTDNEIKLQRYRNLQKDFLQLKVEPGHEPMWNRLENALWGGSSPQEGAT